MQEEVHRNISEIRPIYLQKFAGRIAALLIGILLLTGINHQLKAQVTSKDSTKAGIERKRNRNNIGNNNDSLTFEHRKKSFDESERFYDNLNSRKQDNRILKKLYPLVFKAPPRKEISDTPEIEDQLLFTEHQGKIIRTIQIKKLDIFGTSVHDTLLISRTRLENLLNKTHINSSNAVIKKYLLIEEGELLNPRAIADNEKVLRELRDRKSTRLNSSH